MKGTSYSCPYKKVQLMVAIVTGLYQQFYSIEELDFAKPLLAKLKTRRSIMNIHSIDQEPLISPSLPCLEPIIVPRKPLRRTINLTHHPVHRLNLTSLNISLQNIQSILDLTQHCHCTNSRVGSGN